MALKLTPAETLLECIASIPEDSKSPGDLLADIEAAARNVATAEQVSIIYTLLGGGTAGWADVPVLPPSFPADHRLHLNIGPEWYWLACNLEIEGSGAGRTIGLIACMQRTRVMSKDIQRQAGWTDEQAQLVESQAVICMQSLGEAGGGKVVIRELNNVWSPLGGEVAFGAAPFLFQCGPDSLTGTLDVMPLTWRVVGGENLSFELKLTPDLPADKAFFLQGIDGATPPPREGIYYSWPHLNVAGTLTAEGVTYAVKGTGWLDHESMASIIPDVGGPPPAKWRKPVGIDGWTFCDFNFDNGDAMVLAGFQIGTLYTKLPATYGYYVKRDGDHWTTTAITGTIEMDTFLPLEHDVMMPVSWSCTVTGTPTAGPPINLRVLAVPVYYDGSFTGANQSAQGETPVTLQITDFPTGRTSFGAGYCETVGYEPSASYVARALKHLNLKGAVGGMNPGD